MAKSKPEPAATPAVTPTPPAAELTAAAVLCRVYGWGQVQAQSMIEMLGLDETKIVQAYGDGQSGTEAIDALISAATDSRKVAE